MAPPDRSVCASASAPAAAELATDLAGLSLSTPAKAAARAGAGASPRTSKSPSSLQRPYVIEPREGAHAATLIMLHGFTNSGKKYGGGWMPALAQKLGKETLGTFKVIWLNAPIREVSCYGEERPRLAAWHDYFTDHGGDEGRPEIEEEIDEEQVAWSRAAIHAVIDAEAALLGGDYSRVAVGGQSQGCCMALDAALSHPQLLGGCFASFGQVYSCTARLELPAGREKLRLVAFHGAADRCIAASLALRTYADLIDRGFHQLSVHLEPELTHCEPSDAESDVLCAALHAWGLTEPPEEEEAEADGAKSGKKSRRRRGRKPKSSPDLEPKSSEAKIKQLTEVYAPPQG